MYFLQWLAKKLVVWAYFQLNRKFELLKSWPTLTLLPPNRGRLGVSKNVQGNRKLLSCRNEVVSRSKINDKEILFMTKFFQYNFPGPQEISFYTSPLAYTTAFSFSEAKLQNLRIVSLSRSSHACWRLTLRLFKLLWVLCLTLLANIDHME